MKIAHLIVPSSTEFVGPVISFFQALFAGKNIEDSIVTNIVTSVIEAVGNAINHGNRADIQKKIQIAIQMEHNKLNIEVRDEGSGFNVEDLPDPLAPENLLKPCGRGIFLIRSFMDKVDFNFSDGTTLIMEKVFEKSIE